MLSEIKITLDSLLSGCIGALAGAIVSWVIAWFFSLNSARDNLRAKLLLLKTHNLIQIMGDNERRKFTSTYVEQFQTNYPEILAATLAYRKLLPLPMRYEIDKALLYFRVGENKIAQENPYFKRTKYVHIDVTGDLDFERRIDALLKVIDGED